MYKKRLVLLLMLAAMGCGSPNTYVEPPPPEVTVASPVQRNITEYMEFSGMTQPMERVEIRARVRGFLKERHFVEGAEVKAGQLLLVIDEEPFLIQLEAARTKLLEAEAFLKQAVVSKAREVAQAQVNLMQSRVVLASQEEKRIRSLFERKVSPQADMDEASAAVKEREAEQDSARAHLSQAEATYETSILTGQAQKESATIAVRNAELDLSYCRMKAPIDGRISRSNVDVGNLISGNGEEVLATIVRMEPIHAYATISEADLQKVPSLLNIDPAEGATATMNVPVDLGLANNPDFPIHGQIDYTDPGLDPATGTMRVRGVFLNEDHVLLPGMFVRMRVSIAERSNAMLVPERALGTDQSGQYIFIVDADDKVQYRQVKPGMAIDSLRVVDGDFTVSDRVIVEGLLRVRPGAKVIPKAQDTAGTASP